MSYTPWEPSGALTPRPKRGPVALAAGIALVLVAAVLLLTSAADMPLLHVAGAAFYITISLAAIAGIFEAARWAAPIEAARLGMLTAIASMLWWQQQLPGALAILAIAFCVSSLLWFLPRRSSLTEMEIAPVM